MDETPGTELRETAVLLALPAPHRSARRARMAQRWRQSALVGAVVALGLLQGSRAALGRMPDVRATEPTVAAPAPAELREVDTVRGRLYRPPGSWAVRPPLRLDERRWLPPAPEVATACPESGC